MQTNDIGVRIAPPLAMCRMRVVPAGPNGVWAAPTIVLGIEVTTNDAARVATHLIKELGALAFDSDSCPLAPSGDDDSGGRGADASASKGTGKGKNCLEHLLGLLGKPVVGSLTLVFASQPFGTAEVGPLALSKRHLNGRFALFSPGLSHQHRHTHAALGMVGSAKRGRRSKRGRLSRHAHTVWPPPFTHTA